VILPIDPDWVRSNHCRAPSIVDRAPGEIHLRIEEQSDAVEEISAVSVGLKTDDIASKQTVQQLA
jgi:hypothetical protein